MKQFIYSTILFVLFSCNAVVRESVTKRYDSLPIDSQIAILDVHQPIPEKSELLGTIKFADSGFSTDCDFYSNLSKARKRAREIGANIVKIIESKSPDIISTCQRMKIEFYKYNGDISSIRQIQLQKN
ncbi:hypothetical protein [Cloacibacterium rupense]|nr:hypothetical protein [Cloacibacterium rupense]